MEESVGAIYMLTNLPETVPGDLHFRPLTLEKLVFCTGSSDVWFVSQLCFGAHTRLCGLLGTSRAIELQRLT